MKESTRLLKEIKFLKLEISEMETCRDSAGWKEYLGENIHRRIREFKTDLHRSKIILNRLLVQGEAIKKGGRNV